MFFLTKGKAGIYYGTKLIVVIEEGSYFGEIGCIMGGIRRAGVKALSTCELQALSRRNLNILLAEYPEVGDELKSVARDRASIAKKGKSGESDGDEGAASPNASSSEIVQKNEAITEKSATNSNEGADLENKQLPKAAAIVLPPTVPPPDASTTNDDTNYLSVLEKIRIDTVRGMKSKEEFS
jgi:hypothetical protein